MRAPIRPTACSSGSRMFSEAPMNCARIGRIKNASLRMKHSIANTLWVGVLALGALAPGAPLLAMDQDATFMAAREAFQKGNIERLSRLAPYLQDYPLSGYVNYW